MRTNRRAASRPAAPAKKSRFTAGLLVDNSNSAKEYSRPRTFNAVPLQIRNDVERLFGSICNTYETTTLPMPNRTVQPLENWSARVPMAVVTKGKRQVMDLHLKCVYEGLRSTSGRNEAFIQLSGAVRGRGARAKVEMGKAKGHALFDVEKGFYSEVSVTVNTEIEAEEVGGRLLISEESIVNRTEGNTQGITPVTANPAGISPRPTLRPPLTPNPKGPRMIRPIRPKK